MMKKNDVKIGGLYVAKVSDKLVTVRIDGRNDHGGWNATNTATGKHIRIKSAQRLRRAVSKTEKREAAATRVAKDVSKILGVPVGVVTELDHAAGVPDVEPTTYDPDRCATPRCKGEPTITYLGKPLCQKCWKRALAKQEAGTQTAPDAAGDAAVDAARAGEAKPKAKRARKAAKDAGDGKPKRLSAIDAAAEVLRKTGKPMRCQDLIAAMAEQGLWSSPNGKTPAATLYSALLREVQTKGEQARFRKADRGLFEFNAAVVVGA
jgi:hypothetical protein